MSEHKYNIREDQRGVVSLFVTLIVMVILSIVVIGFSQISRREARAALDRQLSTQAYYAAESGVNDAYSIVSQAILAGVPQSSLNFASSCDIANPYLRNSTINTSVNTGTKYTCVLVNVQPSYLSFHPSTGQAEITDLLPSNPAQNFSTLKIDWENDGPTGQSVDNVGLPSCSNTIYKPGSFARFYPNSTWDTATRTCPPVMKVDLVLLNFPSSELGLHNAVKTFYLYPQDTGGSGAIGSIANGQILPALCTNYCQYNITGLSSHEYEIRMSYIYGLPPSINLSATYDGVNPITFQNAQLQIDSTGKSQDVLRRIKVVMALNPENVLTPPDFALQSNTSICKRLEVGHVGASDAEYINIPGSVPLDISSGPGLLGTGIYNIDQKPPATPQFFPADPPTYPAVSNQAIYDPCDPY